MLYLFAFIAIFTICHSQPIWNNYTPEWITIDSVDNEFIKDIQCFDEFNCITLSKSFTGLRNTIRKTTDAGKSWVNVLVDSMVFVTDSQGKKVQKWPSSGLGLSYPSKDLMIMITDSARLMKSTDGGFTWERQELPVKNKLSLLHIGMANDKIGFVHGGAKDLFLTEDGAKSWTKLSFDPIVISEKLLGIESLNVVDTNNLFITYRYDTLFPNEWYYIAHYFHSSDRGKTWKHLADTTQYCYNVFFVNKDTGFVAGGEKDSLDWICRNMIYKTVNGGKDWSLIYYDTILDWSGITKIDFYDKNNGIAISEASIYRTTDGGNNWIKYYTMSPPYSFYMHWGISWMGADHPVVSSGYFVFKFTELFEDVQYFQDQQYNWLFPNPVVNELNLKEYSKYQIQIFSVYGVKVIDSEFKDKIDVSRLSSGVYFVRIGDKVSKFIKI